MVIVGMNGHHMEEEEGAGPFNQQYWAVTD